MPHWVKRKSGVKGPFSKTQIEGFIETGRLPDGVLISEDPDGPWQPFTISHNDVAVEPGVDSSYESQEMGDEDNDATQKQELWASLHLRMESDASEEALKIIDELETFHLTAKEKEDLKSLRRSLIDGPESDGYADYEDYQPEMRRAKRKRRQSSSGGHTAGQNGDCPFPGSLFENILLGASSSDVDAKNEFSSDWKRIFGVTYVVSFSFAALSIIITAVRADVPISAFSFLLLGLSLGVFIVTALHYATHAALDLNVALLRIPVFRVSSIRHVHIVFTPLVVIAIAAVYFALFSLYATIRFDLVNGNFDASGLMRSSAATLVFAISMSCVILRAVLSPQQLGILVDPKATAGETFLGILAMLVRAPIHAIPIVYPLGLALVLIGTFLLLLISLGVTGEFVNIAKAATTVFGCFFMVWPVSSCVFCLFSLCSIEITQCVFSICRNVELISNPDETNRF